MHNQDRDLPVVSVRLPRDMIEALDILSAKSNMYRSELIRLAIKMLIEKYSGDRT